MVQDISGTPFFTVVCYSSLAGAYQNNDACTFGICYPWAVHDLWMEINHTVIEVDNG